MLFLRLAMQTSLRCPVRKIMFELELYNGSQDLTDFYIEAEKRGYTNNSSHAMLIDYIAKYENASLILFKKIGFHFKTMNKC